MNVSTNNHKSLSVTNRVLTKEFAKQLKKNPTQAEKTFTEYLKKNYHKKCIDNSITMKDELTGHIREYVGDSL